MSRRECSPSARSPCPLGRRHIAASRQLRSWHARRGPTSSNNKSGQPLGELEYVSRHTIQAAWNARSSGNTSGRAIGRNRQCSRKPGRAPQGRLSRGGRCRGLPTIQSRFFCFSELEVVPRNSFVACPQRVVACYLGTVKPPDCDFSLVLRLQSRTGGRDLPVTVRRGNAHREQGTLEKVRVPI